MIWLNALALVGVAAVAAPILIHILVQRRAERFPFPTLRFLQPARLASIRRHVLEDLPLLAVRIAILAVAAAALAGPLLVTPARRGAWNARIVRAIVVDGGPERAALRVPAAPSPVDVARPVQGRRGDGDGQTIAAQATFDTSDVRDGIARAIAWLDAAPPARRELVIVSRFVLGSIGRADLRDVPPEVGIRLEGATPPPAARSVEATPVLAADLATRVVHQRSRTVDLNGPSTSVRESSAAPVVAPIEIDAAADVKRTAEATLAAVLSQRVPAPATGRAARVIFATALPPPVPPSASVPPWIADAIARITTDERMRSGADPLPIAVSGDSSRLSVTTTRSPADLRTALLFRSICDALGAPQTSAFKLQTAAEILTIPDADLRALERPAGEVRSPRLDTIDRDDRRWWWGAVLILLIAESVIRRSQPRQQAEETFSNVA